MTNFERVVGFQANRRAYTNQSLACRLRVSPSTVNNWMHGNSSPSDAKIKALSDVLGIEISMIKKAVSEDKANREAKTNGYKDKTDLLGAGEPLDIVKSGFVEQMPDSYISEDLPVANAIAVDVDEVTVGTTADTAVDTDVTEKQEETPAEEPKTVVKKLLTNIRTVSELQGCACVYKVDTSNEYIEMSDSNGGCINGIIEVSKIRTMVMELNEILNMYS